MQDTRAITSKTRALRERAQKRFKQKIIIISVLVLVCIGMCVFVLTRPFWNITHVTISGTSVIKTDKVLQTVESYKEGYSLFIFSKSNILFFSPKKLEKVLRETFPRIENISVGRQGIHTLAITISERSGVFLWCGDTPRTLSTSLDACKFIDDTGVLFGDAPYFSGPVHFVIFGRKQITEEQPKLGTKLFEETDIDNFIRIEKSFKEHNIISYGVFVTKEGTNILLSRDLLPQTKIVKLNDHVSVLDALKNVFIALDNPTLKEKMSNNFDTLEYLDLRFINKVYFKFNDTTEETIK